MKSDFFFQVEGQKFIVFIKEGSYLLLGYLPSAPLKNVSPPEVSLLVFIITLLLRPPLEFLVLSLVISLVLITFQASSKELIISLLSKTVSRDRTIKDYSLIKSQVTDHLTQGDVILGEITYASQRRYDNTLEIHISSDYPNPLLERLLDLQG